MNERAPHPVVDDVLTVPLLGAGLDIDAVRAATAKVLADDVCWFPVRHHSPTAALHLRKAMLEKRPKVLFLEAPADANELVKHIVDPKTKPPVALYVSYRDDDNVTGLAGIASPSPDVPPRFSAWFPLMAYSPEYVAMKTAAEIGCDVVFFDLPRSALIKEHETAGADGDDHNDVEDAGVDGDDQSEKRGESWEALAVRSTFYAALAKSAGFRTWDECWDALFEDPGRHQTWRAYREDLAAFCAAVRATTPRSRVEQDGTLARERFMQKTLTTTLQERGVDGKDAFVVCGGFHLFLDRDDVVEPPARRPGTHYATVAPYSSFRVSEASGYGAANRAPQWYGLLHDACDDSRGGDADDGAVDAMLKHIVAVLRQGRKEGDGLSSADAIAAAQHAHLLARLRGRRHPVLDDIRDALISCCCKGRPAEEGAHLVQAMVHAEIGNAVGRVTPELGQLPLVHDFYAAVDSLDLGEVMGREKRLTLQLDLRKEEDRRRSVFLHRLVHLEVPLGKMLDERALAGTLFSERWSLAWSPKVEEALIEKNLYGDAVETAAAAVLEEQLAKDEVHAGRACQRLVRSLNMDLPGMMLRLESACGKAIDEDQRFVSLADAVVALLLLDRHAARGALAREALQTLIERAFGRACFLIPDVSSVAEEDQSAVVAGLQSLAEVLLGTSTEGLDKDAFVENVSNAATISTVPFLQGALRGLLCEIRAVDATDLADRVAAYARARPDVLVQAGPFLDGVMAVSKTSLLLGADALVAAVDELLRAADDDAFKTMLPLVRHAFERLHERQRDALAGHVAERYGLREAASITKLETSTDALAEMARIDKRVATIMKEWAL